MNKWKREVKIKLPEKDEVLKRLKPYIPLLIILAVYLALAALLVPVIPPQFRMIPRLLKIGTGIPFILNLLIQALKRIFLSGISVLLIFSFFLMLLRNEKLAFSISAAILFALFYINEFLLQARGMAIQYTDIFCIADALRVSGGYSLPFSPAILARLAVTVAAVILLFVFKIRFNAKKKKKAAVGAICFLLTACCLCLAKTYPAQYAINHNVESLGVPFSLINGAKQSRVPKPDGYSAKAAEAIYERYDETASEACADVDILVIMNESLTDYSLVGSTMYSDDPLEFIHSLEGSDNFKSGRLMVSPFGGTTCNTEFEFLTGSSLAFLGSTIPYLQFDLADSEANSFKSLGYSADAVHPYYETEWKRNRVYPGIGFDSFTSGEDFGNKKPEKNRESRVVRINFGDELEYAGGMISDNECYRKCLEIMDKNAGEGNPSFLFTVTIQNHGPYTDRLTDRHSYIDGNNRDNEPLNTYLSLISYSDKAFEQLMQRLKERERKTVVLMFGDHQPGINLRGSAYTPFDTSYDMDMHTTPYYLWANFDVDWDCADTISPNYLSCVLKKNVGIPLTKWDKIRLDAMEKYPVLTQSFAIAKDGSIMASTDAAADLQDYRICQYYRLFEQ